MLVSYPAIFYFSPSENNSYYVYFPDLGGSGTQGDNLEDALFMAQDYLGIVLADIIESGEKLPERREMNVVSLVDDNPFKDDEGFKDFYDIDKSFVSMVCVDVSEHMGNQELVKKTLTIPKWTNDLGNKYKLNFSKVLTEAIEREVFR